MQLAGGGGEAPSLPPLMRRAPPRRESAPYFVGPRCVIVCVCVCLCVYSRVGASYVTCRPSHLCVCRVGTPPARYHARYMALNSVCLSACLSDKIDLISYRILSIYLICLR